MNKNIKTRFGKISNGRFYLQDIELLDTKFQPGTHFKYIVNIKEGTMKIVPAEEGNKVVKRKLKTCEKSVIDIRDKKSLNIFKNADKLKIEIFEDVILVKGFKENKESPSEGMVSSVVNKVKKTAARIFNIDNYREKEIAKVYISRAQLKKAVGEFEQIGFFDSIINQNNINSKSSNIVNPSPLRDLHIPLEIVSLFCGAGFLDYPFKQLGFKTKFALDKDPGACETYRKNIGGKVVEADIENFDLNTLPWAPLAIMGSPCQKLSAANRKDNVNKSSASAEKLLDIPENLTVRKNIEAINTKKFLIFVWENVPELLKLEGDKLKNEIFTELSDYNIESGVINAADFGSFQKRERAILIGVRKDLGFRIELPKPTHTAEQYRTVKDALYNISGQLPNQQDITKSTDIVKKRMSFIPQGGNWSNIPDEYKTESMLRKNKNGKPNTQFISYYRLSLDKLSPTLINFRKSCITHPMYNRILSVREACRFFDVPDTYVIYGSLASRQQQVANGVCMNVARAIAKKVKMAIENTLVSKSMLAE